MDFDGLENGFDFIRFGKKVASLFKKKKEEKVRYVQDEIFLEKIQRQFIPEFFKNSLKLKEEEVNLFFDFLRHR